MVEWAQFIPAIVGSGLILFILNTGLADYNQPKLVIDVQKAPANGTQKRFFTTVTNEGMAVATNVRITMYYINGYVANYRIVFATENATFTDSTKPNTLTVTAPKLSPHGVIFIHSAIEGHKALKYTGRYLVNYTGNYYPYEGEYYISASYNQGGASPSRSTNLTLTAYKPLVGIVPFSVVVTTFASVALIIVGLVILYQKLNEKRLPNNISDVFVNALMVRKKLKNNLEYKEAFQHEERWSRYDPRDLFAYNVNDIIYFDDFNTEIKKRSSLITKGIESSELRKFNENCLVAAEHMLEGIDWKKFRKLQFNYPLFWKITVPGILAIVFMLMLVHYYYPGFL